MRGVRGYVLGWASGSGIRRGTSHGKARGFSLARSPTRFFSQDAWSKLSLQLFKQTVRQCASASPTSLLKSNYCPCLFGLDCDLNSYVPCVKVQRVSPRECVHSDGCLAIITLAAGVDVRVAVGGFKVYGVNPVIGIFFFFFIQSALAE